MPLMTSSPDRLTLAGISRTLLAVGDIRARGMDCRHVVIDPVLRIDMLHIRRHVARQRIRRRQWFTVPRPRGCRAAADTDRGRMLDG
jgi:hypothetical protein